MPAGGGADKGNDIWGCLANIGCRYHGDDFFLFKKKQKLFLNLLIVQAHNLHDLCVAEGRKAVLSRRESMCVIKIIVITQQ